MYFGSTYLWIAYGIQRWTIFLNITALFIHYSLNKRRYFYNIQQIGGEGGQVKNGKNSNESGWLQGGGKGIHRYWISRTMISISVIRVQTLLQTGVWFCYKCSRLVSGFAISIPDRQVSESGENYALDSILVFFLAF